MIEKIISGGRTPVERGALNAAVELGIPYGGWTPGSPMIEDDPSRDRHQLAEVFSSNHDDAAMENEVAFDGMLIISHGKPTGDAGVAKDMAEKQGRPCLHIDLTVIRGFSAAQTIKSWLANNGVKTLYVTGPPTDDESRTCDDTVRMLKAVYYLFFIEEKRYEGAKPLYPRTLDAAVDRLMSEVPLKDKVLIAKMDKDDLHLLDNTLGAYIRDRYGLLLKRGELIRDCRFNAKDRDLDPEQASALIIEAFWKRVRETHLLRAVK